MSEVLHARWRADGATLSAASRPLHFGDPAGELAAALGGSVLGDRSDLARILATGPDFLGLLNRLSTAEVASLAPGAGRTTVLTTGKGRIVERLCVSHLGSAGVLCVGGAGSEGRVLEHLARFTFAERTGLEPATARTFQFVLVGPQAAAPLGSIGLDAGSPWAAQPATIAGREVHLLGHDGLSAAGRSVTGRIEDAVAVWDALTSGVRAAGGRLAGDEALEAWRVLRGLPASGHELTLDHNPLEAGLWEAVSFAKGCYVGQEVVARLRTYDKVSRSLVRLELPRGASLPPGGTPLYAGEREVGELTSAVHPPGGDAPVGLAYVKRRELGGELSLSVGRGGGLARVVELRPGGQQD